MRIIGSIAEIREAVAEFRRISDKQVGLVPTMGYLHQGHASLIEKAAGQCGLVVVSIFVNPLQFGPNEDFERYPRDPERDMKIAEAAGADLIFMPPLAEMYPQYPSKTKVIVSDITGKLCGASRPGHFDGVSTVVMKLFHIVKPDQAFFGLKDAQQVAVVQQMVADTNLDLQIVPCPIVREKDGLAMSSRNVYLNAEERKQSLVLNESLNRAEAMLREGRFTLEAVKQEMERIISSAPLAIIDYIEIVAYPALIEPDLHDEASRLPANSKLLIALAVKFGATRLIDNRIISTSEVLKHV